ncbi:hypothetical protein [Bowmanella pacifica]|uniref:Lipoprotein n=1 Tax=Bowmanella pacifica TaxID=502051 RepID=A0A918DM65_9ALTE|nr:hypothetical protein [Bowmanella pacifica]GGO73591.1 putative lipoprotein [Bowmanella pacifica]
MFRRTFYPLAALTIFSLVSHSAQASSAQYVNKLSHATPYIPPQCYTDPVVNSTLTTNPCYACHTNSKRPNLLNDTDVQQAYSFPEKALLNPWLNMYKDRQKQIAAIADKDILNYVREDNYLDDKGEIKLAQRLTKQALAFDQNNNGRWDGYLPDSYFNFDQQGFDRSPAGEYTGWRSYAYYPMPGSFMPTNGSTDDVSIRLAEVLRQNEQGQFDLTVYKTNLAIVEALIREQDIPIDPVDEHLFSVDLDKDGQLGMASKVKYDWAPLEKRWMSYVGKARLAQKNGDLHLAAKLFPEGTEFLHSVRYLDVNAQQQIAMAPRMKELRYARKDQWLTYYQLEVIVADEIKERHDFPSRTKLLRGDAERGVQIAQGWTYQGFIEDKQGELRPQTFEEHGTCAGCHSGMGALVDTTLSFYRKLPADNFQQGWYHWQQKSLAGLPEPRRESDGEYEYSYYLKQNPTGDEFRANQEVQDKFFDSKGRPKAAMFARLNQDISTLLMPSIERALALNKAYKLIVDEQSFHQGRDAVLAPLDKVLHKQVEANQPTGIKDILSAF